MAYTTNRDRTPPALELTKAPWPLAPLDLFLRVGPAGKGMYDLQWSDPRTLALNSRFALTGVNLYRSFDSEYGPFHRITDYPLGATCYRDQTDVEVVEEDVTDRFILQGVASTGQDEPRYTFSVSRTPIVQSGSQRVVSNDPYDVWVTVDGVRVPLRWVDGFTGEVEIDPVWYPNIQKQLLDTPVLPHAGARVMCTYRTMRTEAQSFLRTDLAQRVFYRATSVGVPVGCLDGGCGPTDLVETPLERAATVSNYETEKLDWIWRPAVQRNRWLLENGGERVQLYLRKNVGYQCPCIERDWRDPRGDCVICYGTGIVGGYEGPFEAIIAPGEAAKRVSQSNIGRTVAKVDTVFMGPSPILCMRDFLVKPNGVRYSIGEVGFPTARGMVLQQHFPISQLDETDIRYRVPLQDPTRYNILTVPPRGPELGGPTPITEKSNIPDERELRGRTITWENTTYLTCPPHHEKSALILR